MAKRRKSVFAKSSTDINKMTLSELQSFIKKATPYMVNKARRLSKSKYAAFSSTLEHIDYARTNDTNYGVSGEGMNLPQFIANVGKHGITNTNLTQVRKSALLLASVARSTETPADLAKSFTMTEEEIENLLRSRNADRAAREFKKLTDSKEGLNSLRKYINNNLESILLRYGSDEDGIDIRDIVENYGEETDEFYLELFKKIKEVKGIA